MSDVLRELAERLERDSIEAMDVGRPHLADRLTDDMETLRLAADVLDAIPDKDDPVGWVLNAINDQADAEMVYSAVAEVYCNLTRGRLSNPNTAPATIIAEVEQFINEDIAEALKEAAEEADDDLRALRGVIPGDDKRLVAEWAVKITNAVMAYDAATYGIVRVEAETALDALLYACPISVRAALRGEA